MKKQLQSIFIVISILLTLTACAKPDLETTTGTEAINSMPTETEQPTELPTEIPTELSTEEPTEPALTICPLNVSAEYTLLAVDIPDIVFSTTGQENGLAGTVCNFIGTVTEVIEYSDNTFNYVDVLVATDKGNVLISNLYKTVYEATVEQVGEAETKLVYTDDPDNYIVPAIGEVANFYCVYIGYSEKHSAPAFYLGASDSLYDMADLEKPSVNSESSIITISSDDNFIIGNLKFSLPSGMSVIDSDENSITISAFPAENSPVILMMLANDVSSLTQDIIDPFVLVQNKQILEALNPMMVEDFECRVSDFDAVGQSYLIYEDGTIAGNGLTFSCTDTWYTYTFSLNFLNAETIGDVISDISEEVGILMREAEYVGEPLRY